MSFVLLKHVFFLCSYTSGVYAPSSAAVFVGGHSVKIIGWGVDDTSNLPYWIAANSWAATWGKDGFFHILRGSDTCGIERNSIWALPKQFFKIYLTFAANYTLNFPVPIPP